MNASTVLGMIGGIALLAGSLLLTASEPAVFLNWPGLLLVLGGTVAATLLSYPLREVLRVFKVFAIVLRTERTYEKEDVDEIAEIARLWQSGQIKKIEDALPTIHSPFLRTGLQLIIDGTPLDDILELLRWRIQRLEAKEHAEAQVFRSMASYAPAFGMLGTLLGLVNMLHGMAGDNFDNVGKNLAVALITTFYGIILANLLFKPIATKLEQRTQQRVAVLNMVLEGIVLVSERRSPTFVRETLYSFIAHHDDEVHGRGKPAPTP